MERTHVVIVAVLAIGATGLAGVFLFFLAPNVLDGSTTSSNTAHFTIMATERGFNDSVDHQGAWPVMHATKGQTVIIRVINSEVVEAHGFEIQHYFTGVSISPRSFYDVKFIADQDGTFRVYCNIFCLVHSFMQNGQLVVTG
ncbi:MAG: hypothetical protein OK422_01350 [Thaumarchaeota archaeon]|nr:hypothetical protein [Nitrososphaerota archaeon]